MANKDDEAISYVLHMAKEHGVKFIRLWFTDILGSLKGVAITIEELERSLREGVSFDGSSIEGFARVNESDMYTLPDPSTFRILPWRPKENAVARMFCDIHTPQGDPYNGDPRFILKKTMADAAKMGFTYYVAPELEFFYFKDSEGTELIDHGEYFEQTHQDLVTELRRETVLNLEEMGIPVDNSHHEVSPSQHEIDLRYTDSLTMADAVMTYRLIVKDVASRHGVYATFMPKPIYGINGSGMHVHQYLFKDGKNAFLDKKDPWKISKVARSFIAGLLKHAPEITLVTNQWVNSYKRFVPGFEAPTHISWGRANRSDLIRVPTYKRGSDDSARIEYRAPDPACNPYIAFATMLAAGLEGVTKNYEPPEAVEENIFTLSEADRKSRGIQVLPESLSEAIKIAESSNFLKKTLGPQLFQSLIENKKLEWENFRTDVTGYETKRYLKML